MPTAIDVADVYRTHVEHVWLSLARLGVREADLPDLVHDVFLVVQRRQDEFDATRSMRGWLWGIALGLARNYRRRLATRVEDSVERFPEGASHGDAESQLDMQRRAARGRLALEALDPERRAVFVMFEVEGMSGRAIAETLDVAIGTVHSRLHAARAELALALGAEES
jgi:RNA polymerase sigma-70 factor (ECF subfamily)